MKVTEERARRIFSFTGYYLKEKIHTEDFKALNRVAHMVAETGSGTKKFKKSKSNLLRAWGTVEEPSHNSSGGKH